MLSYGFGNNCGLSVLGVACAEKEGELTMLLFKPFQLRKPVFFYFKLGLIFLLKVGPLHRIVMERLAQSIAGRNVFHPQINFRSVLFHAAGPQAIDEYTVAIFFRCGFVDSLDANHWVPHCRRLRTSSWIFPFVLMSWPV